ncbi:PIF1-like helicase [Medicago truncatula]|uniref:ATP-dependent DNA helicase n=1 Tax=Medicago truncatula TaxID=3880 RepID=G7L083_MEDTR|nr:PIF1-like helicase [Medicago truncatula]
MKLDNSVEKEPKDEVLSPRFVLKVSKKNRRSLTDFKSMPKPNAANMPTFTNKLIVDELNYNKDELEKTRADMLLMLTDEQRCVHDKIKESDGSDDGGFFFLYGYGGTGKPLYRKHCRLLLDRRGYKLCVSRFE